MIELVVAILLHILSNDNCQLVVSCKDIIDVLPDESCFDPHRLSNDSLGNLVIDIDDECEDGVCNPSSITTSRKCFRYIL